MRFKTLLTFLSAALLLSSCSQRSDISTAINRGSGMVSFNCTTHNEVDEITRSSSGSYTIPNEFVPLEDDLTIAISGSYIDAETKEECDYSYGPMILNDYNALQPEMVAGGNYTAHIFSGDVLVEGEGAAYFSGIVDFEIVAEQETSKEVVVSLQNSIITLEVDSFFTSYYSSASFTIKTSAGNSFEFVVPSQNVIFVEPNTTLTLSGTAQKMSGEIVTFNENIIGVTKAQTISRISITGGNIGGESINITLNDTITEMKSITVELNQ